MPQPQQPQCSDYGDGWSGEYPNCTYSAPSFGGGVESLGFQDILPADVQGTPWSEFFDPYDPTREQMATTGAGIDIRQLQDVWSLQSGQLDEAYGLKTGQLEEAWGLQQGQLGENWQQRKGSLGAEAGLGYRQAIGQGSQAKRKSGMAFSGGAEEMQRMGMQDVQGAYQRAFGLGQTAYEQAMESGQMGYQQALATGQLGVTQATTDIGQQLQEDIYGYQQDWEKDQRSTLNVLLGMDIWGEDAINPPYVPSGTTGTGAGSEGTTIGGGDVSGCILSCVQAGGTYASCLANCS
jgi:hypothetical protein